MIAVTFALPAESSDFVRLLESRTSGAAESHTVLGALHGRAISILHTGVGEKTTRARIAAFLQQEAPEFLISAGFAGALSDRLNIGDLFLAENYSVFGLTRVASSLQGFRCTKGTLATAPRMIDSMAERLEFGKARGADAVDMETQFIATSCTAASVPMISVRAISDTPATPFPAPPHVLFDLEKQKTDMPRLFFHLATHPASIGRFIAFGRQIQDARRSLTEAIALLVRDGLV